MLQLRRLVPQPSHFVLCQRQGRRGAPEGLLARPQVFFGPLVIDPQRGELRAQSGVVSGVLGGDGAVGGGEAVVLGLRGEELALQGGQVVAQGGVLGLGVVEVQGEVDVGEAVDRGALLAVAVAVAFVVAAASVVTAATSVVVAELAASIVVVVGCLLRDV